MKNPFSVITHATDWEPIGKIPSINTKKYNQNIQKYGKCGVYLIATVNKLPTEYISEDILYIGMSGDIGSRLSVIRQPSGNHGCKTYIKNKKIDISTVYVKILYCSTKEEAADLERYIHTQMEEKYGYRFAWKEASGGSDGILVRIQDSIDQIKDMEDLKLLANYIDTAAFKLHQSTWRL